MHISKIRFINLPKELCHHTLGKEHTHTHRMLAGTIVMVIGVAIAKSAHYFDATILQFSLDMVGYAVHGLGAAPFIEYVVD